MATLKEYYEKDFAHVFKLHVKISLNGKAIEGCVLYDFIAYCSFLAVYTGSQVSSIDEFLHLIKTIAKGGNVVFDNLITLPSAKTFDGEIQLRNQNTFEILTRSWGENEWKASIQLPATKRVFIYSENDLSEDHLRRLHSEAANVNAECEFRSIRHAVARGKFEKPLAFICHDSRDKERVALKVALGLQTLKCPVWYDEFSLKVGDHLRLSIEKGLKECRKCILILSPNFFSNSGWTKTEFDSIFSRQILEQSNLVLPIWVDVSAKDVYEYSPSLTLVKGITWNDKNIEVICKELFRAVDN
jgi:hypothetical protein